MSANTLPQRAKDAAAKGFTAFHRAVFKATKGRVGGTGFGMPVVILTTTGRKSGLPRETMLTSPVQPGDSVVLVASYGGDDREPLWYKNLKANPDVHLMMRGANRKMVARTASADEKDELWPSVTAAYKGYAAYQKRTDRDIPLVILDPAP